MREARAARHPVVDGLRAIAQRVTAALRVTTQRTPACCPA